MYVLLLLGMKNMCVFYLIGIIEIQNNLIISLLFCTYFKGPMFLVVRPKETVPG